MEHTIHILLVEDSVVDAELITEAFKDAGLRHQITTVHDGEKALSFVKMKKPDLILLDLNIPKKNGLEVLKELKSHEKLKIIPVIVLTNSSSKDDIIKAYKSYCNAYIRKPIGFEQIIESIKNIDDFWVKLVNLPTKIK